MVCRRVAPWGELRRIGWEDRRGFYVGAGAGRGVWVCAQGPCTGRLSAAHLRRGLRRDVAGDELAAVAATLDQRSV